MSTISQFNTEARGPHISETELAALLKQRLTPAQNARLQQHLPHCHQCHELFQDARDFGLPQRAEDPVVGEIQIQASWNQVKTLLLQAETSASNPNVTGPKTLAAIAGRSSRLALPLAAILFLSLSLVTIALWRHWQRASVPATVTRTTKESSPLHANDQPALPTNLPKTVMPQVSKPKPASSKRANQTSDKSLLLAIHDVVTLVVTSGEKGATETSEPQSFQIPIQATQLRFKFIKYKPTEFPSYQIELINAVGEVQQVVRGSIAKNKKDRLIEAVFKREGLAAGVYQLRLTGKGRLDGDLTPLTTPFIKLSFQP